MTAVDSAPPVITGCPDSQTYTIPIEMSTIVVTWTEPTATDDSGAEPTVIRTHQPGQQFGIGTTEVIYVFMDAAGNEAMCTFSIIGNRVYLDSCCTSETTYTLL